MSAYEWTVRRFCMCLIGLLGLIMMPFGGTGPRLAAWAVRRRDG